MRRRLPVSVDALALTIGLVVLVPATGAGQSAALRTPWGDPDLQGVWDFRTLTPFERPKELAGKELFTRAEAEAFLAKQLADIAGRDSRVPDDIVGNYNQFWFDRGTTLSGTMRTSQIVDPTDGRLPPLTPEAQTRATSDEAKRISAARRGFAPAVSFEDLDAGDRCIMHQKAGPPINPGGYNNNVQIFQAPGYVAILNEQIHDVRIIPLDGRPHASSQIRQWMGNARGRWEGRTLVVESINFNGKHDQVGRPLLSSGEQLTLVERFTRADAGTLHYRYTVTDPAIWVRPWSAEYTMVKNPEKVYEYACHEGNLSLYQMLAGSRAAEKAADAAAKTSSR
jgi:hypothetical protein